MATVTADFTTASFPRSRVERSTDGLIAGYIHALALASVPPAEDLETLVNPRRRLSEDASRRGNDCRGRGGRVGRSLRPKQLIAAL
jgi:hypothetical protein